MHTSDKDTVTQSAKCPSERLKVKLKGASLKPRSLDCVRRSHVSWIDNVTRCGHVLQATFLDARKIVLRDQVFAEGTRKISKHSTEARARCGACLSLLIVHWSNRKLHCRLTGSTESRETLMNDLQPDSKSYSQKMIKKMRIQLKFMCVNLCQHCHEWGCKNPGSMVRQLAQHPTWSACSLPQQVCLEAKWACDCATKEWRSVHPQTETWPKKISSSPMATFTQAQFRCPRATHEPIPFQVTTCMRLRPEKSTLRSRKDCRR